MGLRDTRPGRWALRDRRWPALRLEALRRDGWQCVQCGRRGRLEVDHILPVRERPDLAFVLANLQSLCGSCHAKKTRQEFAIPEPDPERNRWRTAVADLARGL